MADCSQASAPRRRVRTGCLTCRGRRRKCDEGKPQCENCRTKNLHCRYGLNITFVESRKKERGEPERIGNGSNTQVPPTERPANDQQVASLAGLPEAGPQSQPSFADDSVLDYLQNSSEDQLLSTNPAGISNLVKDPGLQSSPPVQLFSGSSFEPFPRTSASSFSSPPCATISQSWNSFAQRNFASADAVVVPGRPSILDILTYYRYHTAVQIDLGVGEEYFGVQVLHRAAHCLRIQRSILSLASYQRAVSSFFRRQDEETASFEYATEAEQILEGTDEQQDSLISQTLLTLRRMIMSSPRLWEKEVQGICGAIASLPTGQLDELWHLIGRLCLAARLMAKDTPPTVDLSLLSRRTIPIFAGQQLSKKQQLGQIMSILGRSLLFSVGQNRPQLTRKIPVTAEWQSCWSNSQLWYAARSEDMQQIFEAESSQGLNDVSLPNSGFPILIFSNACALVANIVHHLTSLLLLQHKPRLVKAVADFGSSTSAQWHALRVIGIVASFDSSSIWNPLVVAAVIHAAKGLSHPSQLRAVGDLLRVAIRSNGMNLQEEIQNLEAAEPRF